MAIRDIRVTRLEGRVQTIEDVQSAVLDQLDTVVANQDELKANQDELKASQDELKANQVKIIELIHALMQDIADIKAHVIGRPMGFAPRDDDS